MTEHETTERAVTELRRTRPEGYRAGVEEPSLQSPASCATTGDVARHTGVTTGTASAVLKERVNGGMVDLIRYGDAMLTEAGRRQVRRTDRRQRLLELLLSQSLGTDWNTAADEPWRLQPGCLQ